MMEKRPDLRTGSKPWPFCQGFCGSAVGSDYKIILSGQTVSLEEEMGVKNRV
jgi:hypothetical protein